MKITAKLSILILVITSFIHAPELSAWPSKKKNYDAYIASLPEEGEAPTIEYVQRATTAYFKRTLKDPDSAKYEWGSIERGAWKGIFEEWGTPGWIATVTVNAKNSYGAYVGYTDYKFIFRSGSIVEVYRYSDRHNGWEPSIGMRGKPIPPID